MITFAVNFIFIGALVALITAAMSYREFDREAAEDEHEQYPTRWTRYRFYGYEALAFIRYQVVARVVVPLMFIAVAGYAIVYPQRALLDVSRGIRRYLNA